MFLDDGYIPVQANLWTHVEGSDEVEPARVYLYVLQEADCLYLALNNSPDASYLSIDLKDLYRGLAASMLTLDDRMQFLAAKVNS